MPSIAPVKGTRDFYPEDLAFRRWLYERIRAVSESFGYQEFDGPFLERLELYAAKSGDELVKEQSFVFPDRGGDLVTLRPELTLSLARMVAARAGSLPRPIRWWSFGPFWRYERPQKGRSREFFQWNADLVGVDSPEADAELVAVAAEFFRSVALTPSQIRIRINDRRLVNTQLDRLGIAPGTRSEVFRLIDRREKASPRVWEAEAAKAGLADSQLSELARLLGDREAWQRSPELTAFMEAARVLGVAEFLEYDPSVIRGLDYYTGIVFEASDISGGNRAVLGGGRYDNLVADVGGDPLPGVGFAMGDMVVGLVIQECGVAPTLRPDPAQVLVTQFDAAFRGESLQIASELRRAGIRAAWYPQADRLPKQLKYADRQGIPWAVIQGSDELAAGTVTLKNLLSTEQREIARRDLAAVLRGLLAEAGGG